MIALAVICVLGGFLLLPSLRPFINNAVDVLIEGAKYSAIILGETAK